MAKIKHIALITVDPERLAKFYEEVFEMKRLNSDGNGAIYMTDGYINVALLTNKAEGKPNGLNHFGFEIEDQEEIADRIEKWGINRPGERPADRPYAERRGMDPEGNNFDLSVHGFQDTEYKAERDTRVKPKEKVDA